MVDKTLEAFGLSVEEMKEANRQAAEQMLPVPYDIPGEVSPTRGDRFGDTAARAAKDSWEEAKARFQSRGTQEGVAGAIPEADSSVLNTFAAGLGYAADVGLSGLAASDAAWRYSVGLASELIPGMDKNQEQRFTRDVSSIPEAFAGNITGIFGNIGRLPDVRQATTGSRAPTIRPSAVIRRDDQFRGEGNMSLSYLDGRTPADFVGQFAIRTTKQDQIDDIIESGLVRQKVNGYGRKKKSTLYFGLQDTPETKAGIMPGQLTTSQPYALVAKADEAAKYDNRGGIPLDALQHIWTMRDGQMIDILPEVLQANQNFNPTNTQSFNKGGMVDKTPEAFGLTYEEMEKRNRDAADQMLPLPYDIEPRVNVLKLPRTEFLSYLDEVVQGDTPRRDFLIREYNKANSLTGGLSTEPEEGRRSVAGSGGFLSKPEGEAGLGALSGLRLEPAVGAAGIAQGLEQAITATGRSAQGLMPSEDVTLEALGVAGITTAGGLASRGPSALDFDPNQVNIFGGQRATNPGYDRSGGRLPESVGADGMYRFEIDDSPMVVVSGNIKTYDVPNSKSLTKLPQDTSKLGDIMIHDDFFTQYPELGEIPVIFNSALAKNNLGRVTSFEYPDGRVEHYLQLNSERLLGEPELLKRVLIHEIQHAVQDREGFAGGTTSSSTEVRERVFFEIESPENVEIWNDYTKDLEAFRKPENLVAPLEAARDFILAYSDKNGIRLRDPNFLDRIKDRFTGREQSIVEGNLRVMLDSVEIKLENIKSGYKVNFDHYRGGLDSIYQRLGSIVGKEDKDLFEGIVGFSPDLINPKGWGLRFDTMEWFSDIFPMLPDLPAPGTDKFSGISEDLLYSTYRRKRGEVESENSAIRAEMSLQERFDTSPEDTELSGQGIPRSRQWGDPYNSGGSSSSQIRQETNPREFNEGGLAMERQMNTMMAEGGIKDSGMNRDPISGNEIPAGSLAKEVRDDVDAKLSEGEYVVPADVVRFFGVNYFEKLRQKAKAGLEEMDRDGRIGGDPVGAPMGDMDEALSDEEMFALNEMFKGGMVSGYAPGGDVTANQSQLPANEFQLPSSIFATSPPPPAATTPTTLYGPSGDVMVLMLPTEQERYNELLSQGYSTEPVVTPTTGGGESRRDRDDSPSAIATPQVTGGEGFNPFSLDEEASKSLSDNPLAFGKGALDGDRLFSSRTLAGAGSLAGIPGMVFGGGVGAVLELQDIAKARAGLILAKNKGLEGTPEFLALEKEIKEKEKGMNLFTRAFDKTGLFTGQGYVDSLQTAPTTVASTTAQAIPTDGGSTRSTRSDGVTYDTTRSTGSDGSVTETSKIAEGTSAAPTRSIRPVGRPNRTTTSTPREETMEEKLKRGGGFNKGGLVQRPKKKPVAKK